MVSAEFLSGYDFAGGNMGENAVHGSDSLASATRELAIFFDKHEFVNV